MELLPLERTPEYPPIRGNMSAQSRIIRTTSFPIEREAKLDLICHSGKVWKARVICSKMAVIGLRPQSPPHTTLISGAII